jgi:transcriptional regulator with XRE-family HTH domain
VARSTPGDEVFKRRVAKEFLRARDRALKEGWSMEEFVARLGITRAAFHKHVTGKSIPSLRVLSKARKYWGVQLSYAELGEDFIRVKRKNPGQMEFRFSLADISTEQIEVKKFSLKGEKAVELLIRIDFSKSA